MLTRVGTAVDSDLGSIADLAARTFPLACPPELPREAIDSFIARHLSAVALQGHLAAPGHDLLAARGPGGELVGYALLIDGTEMDPSCADQIRHRPTVGISKLYVDPAHLGTGVAADMLDAITALCAGRGAHGLWLATNVANARARAFYVKNGFLERGHRVFLVGGRENDDVVYEKTLLGLPGRPPSASDGVESGERQQPGRGA